MTRTVERWMSLHQNPRHQLEWPSEHVVRFLAGLGSGPRFASRALDIGCGNGRHTRLLDARGFHTYAIDLPNDDMRDLLYPPNLFDVAIAYAVFYYGTPQDADQAIAEMHRVLRPGGRGFVCVRTDRDWRYNHCPGGTLNLSGEPEDGMDMHFLHEEDIEHVYGAFSEVAYELTETTTHGRGRTNSDWLITVTK